jgi:hypothetical protein
MCSRLTLARVASVRSGSHASQPKSFVHCADVGSFVPKLISFVRYSRFASYVQSAGSVAPAQAVIPGARGQARSDELAGANELGHWGKFRAWSRVHNDIMAVEEFHPQSGMCSAIVASDPGAT